MVKYHFNPTTGKSSECHAEQKTCRFVHGDSPDASRRKYEETMSNDTLLSLKKKVVYSEDELRALPISILKDIPLKDLDAAQLSQTLRHESIVLGVNEKIIDSSINLATILHAHQTRRNRGTHVNVPYIEHPLRNALRLIRLGVDDQDVIVGAVLHDTIEDGSQVFMKYFRNDEKVDEAVAREHLAKFIEGAYGRRTLAIVEGVTNDIAKPSTSVRTKHRIYRNHVKEKVMNNPDVFLVKVSDFIDNATGLYHNDIPGKERQTFKQASKYLPVVDVFRESMKNLELPVSEEGHMEISRQLEKTTVRLQNIIKKYENQFTIS